jgi:hypothetical protein
MFVAAFVLTAIGNSQDAVVFVYTMEFYSAIKKNEILLFADK